MRRPGGRALCEDGGTETGLPVSAGAAAARRAPCRPGAEGGDDTAPRRAPHRTRTRQRYVSTGSRIVVKRGKRSSSINICLVMKWTIWKPWIESDRVMVREIAQQLVVNLVESYVFMTFAHGIGKQILAY